MVMRRFDGRGGSGFLAAVGRAIHMSDLYYHGSGGTVGRSRVWHWAGLRVHEDEDAVASVYTVHAYYAVVVLCTT